MRLSTCVFASTTLLVLAARADVSFPSFISDGMVLQRETDAKFFGFARPGERVSVQPSWFAKDAPPAQAVADDRGLWQATLNTRGASAGPHTIDVHGDSRATLKDVLLGDVWLCSGQSNMEWALRDTDNAEQVAGAMNLPNVRLFTVTNDVSLHERLDVRGAWAPCTSERALAFSAVGGLFAAKVASATGVPVGIISADWGGTRVEAWMSDEALGAMSIEPEALARQRAYANPLTREESGQDMQAKWWSMFAGAATPVVPARWAQPGFDDSAWKPARVPSQWDGDLATFDGVVYYRTSVTIAPESAGKSATLTLGPIDDRDQAFVNGTLVGATYADNEWNTPRVYSVPAGLLKEGANTIAVAVLDTAGPGGIFGEASQMALTPEGAHPIALAGAWKHLRGAGVQQLPGVPTPIDLGPNAPGMLYRAMVAPLTRMSLKGVLWYQGESNRDNAAEYATRFPAMIEDWRRAFGQRELPFFFVQIAPYTYAKDMGETALLRESQAAALRLANTGMAVTMDVGNPADIHPRNKEPVAQRLADLALGKATSAPAPAVRFDDGAAHVALSNVLVAAPAGGDAAHTASSAHATSAEASGFELAGADKRFYQARASMSGDGLRVVSEDVQHPVALRYLWCDSCSASLIDSRGVPIAPFRTDTWGLGETTRDQEAALAQLRDADPSFVNLFNGENLRGWVNVNTGPSTWSVGKDERGRPVIACTGTPTGVLRTGERYENFVLELEYRHLKPRSNSGLFVWSDAITARGQPFTRSIEVQVMDGMQDTWYTSDGDVFPIHGARMTPLTRPQSSGRAMPLEARANPSPLWNHYRVTCVEGSLDLAVNGKVVTRGKDISPRMGYICLESEGGPVEFRNLRIKTLPPSRTLTLEDTAQVDEGFVSIFNAENFDGWDMQDANKGHWTIDDWVLRYDGKGTHLATTRKYKNYELIADWRWSAPARDEKVPIVQLDGSYKLDAQGNRETEQRKVAGDSGVYLRGTERSQVNIWCWGVGSGELWDIRNDATLTPAQHAAATPSKAMDKPVGQWNRFHITLVGDRVSVDLNGERVITNAQMPGVNESGPILLQHHGEPIEFANIYVKELP